MNNLRAIYREHAGRVSDKWSSYLTEYDRLLAPWRQNPVRLLEIGIQNGGSLEIWSRYFPQAEKLVGCDINPDCARLEYADPRIAVVIGNADTEASEQRIKAISPQYDCIIDDGSHRSGEIIGAFHRYFPCLRPGGLYIVEDLHCSYWHDFEGGLFHPFSAIAYFKRLVDLVNREFWGVDVKPESLLEDFSRFHGAAFDHPAPTGVHSVEFINSICVIRKGAAQTNSLGPRMIAGAAEDIVPGHHSLHGMPCLVPDQRENAWADGAACKEERLSATLAQRDRQNGLLQQAVAEGAQRIADQRRIIDGQDEEMVRLRRRLAQREAQNAELKSQVAEREVCLAAHEPTLAARDRRIAELDETLAERDGLLQSILSSESWRLTAPLRLAGGYGKRVHRLLRVVPERVRATGGLRPAAEKALAIYRNEGLPGIRRRWASREAQEIALPEISAFAAPTTAFAFDPQAGYALRQGPAGYAYVPPRRPDNLAHICQNMVRRPQFSILVPVYDTPPEILRKTIDSVLAQWYPDWELILADDASTDPATRQCLAQLAHPAITVLHLPENRGISGASNAALARARGDYVVLLDHDDELTEDCLFELALCIEGENPDYIYSDEDKIGADGGFTEPHFKPDWSPDTLMSTMYVCHVSCIRRELLNEIDGFRSEFDGCQDWDLILRLTERTQRIHHLPKVLYHWRIIPASTAADIAAKPYILERSRQVREEALARRGLSGTIEAVEQVKGYFRVNYRLSGNPLISVIIPSRDNAAILRRCVASIQERSSYRNFEIIIVDNGSVAPDARDYLDAMQRRGQATVLRHDQPFNFSQLNNVGAEAARGDILLFLNDDTEVLTADWLERLGGYARLAHVGAVGAKLLYPGGKRIQHAGIVNFADGPGHAFFGLDADVPGYFMRNLLEYDWLAVTGACLMVEKTKFVAVGGFDERFPVAYNDVDFCLRLRASGYYNVVGQAVRLIHHESASRGNDHASPVKLARLERDKKCLFATHPQYLQHDPFHSPNLHPNGFHFETVS